MTSNPFPWPHRCARLAPIAIAAVALTLVACGGGGSSSASGDVGAGKTLYMQTCATCHGQDANGLPNLGKGLHDNEFTKSKSDAELLQFLKTGRPMSSPLNTTGIDMPPKGGNPALGDQDLQNIVAYLRTL